jgi:hypothetical protein
MKSDEEKRDTWAVKIQAARTQQGMPCSTGLCHVSYNTRNVMVIKRSSRSVVRDLWSGKRSL